MIWLATEASSILRRPLVGSSTPVSRFVAASRNPPDVAPPSVERSVGKFAFAAAVKAAVSMESVPVSSTVMPKFARALAGDPLSYRFPVGSERR